MIRTQLVSRTIRSNKQSRARYKTRLDSGWVSLLTSLLLSCSSSLSESELKSLVSRSSLILFLVLLACSLVSLSLTCNKVSLHFRVVRPGMWRRRLTRQDTRSRTHKVRSWKRQLWDNLFCSWSTQTKGLGLNLFFGYLSPDKYLIWTYFLLSKYLYYWCISSPIIPVLRKYNSLIVKR